MTTFEGKSASYVAGKQSSNKEPLYTAVGKKLLESLYCVHRERVMKVEKTVDDRFVAMDFLTDTSWKQIARRHRELTIMKHNEEFYARLSKLENTESAFLREQKRHQRHIAGQAEYSKRLKAHGRRLKVDKINRENEHMHHRIANATPFYSRKQQAAEYQRNVDQINASTKTDYTAGHLLNIPKKLRPLPIKKQHKKGSLEDKMEQVTKASRARSKKTLSSSLDSSQMMYGSSEFSAFPQDGNIVCPQTTLSSSSADKYSSDVAESYGEDLGPDGTGSYENYDDSFENASAEDDDKSLQSLESVNYDGEKIFLVSRPFAIPFDTKNSIVEAYISKDYDEQIIFRCCAANDQSQVLAERFVSIDAAYDLLDNAKNIKKSGSNEELMAIRTILTNMFREADTAQRGYLSYEEFQNLLKKINLGISPEELLFVISEADEDENGFVDYQEFIPLAVDMIQAFSARAKAKSESHQKDSEVDSLILEKVTNEDLQMMIGVLEDAINQVDVKKTGFIRTPDLRAVLRQFQSVGISDLEINMICQTISRDDLGRSNIREFRKALYDVRYLTMKNTIVESQATDLEKYLFELFKGEEKKMRDQLINDVDFQNTSHMLPLRNIINLMVDSPRLSLNRLQVVVIASEATVIDGYVDYRQFVPIAAKTIEIMYEPHALKQRAELIEKTDLTPESLLHGLTPEVFKRRLLVLFKSCDTDKSGFLDMKEFKACLESLDLKLTPQEVNALMASADADGNGQIDFNEFAEFCAHNLMHLEREKHIRALRDSIQNDPESSTAGRRSSVIGQFNDEELDAHLRRIFNIADVNGTGNLTHHEVKNLFSSLDIKLTTFELSVLMSEADVNHDGLINYEEFVPICADLLKVMNTDKENLTKEEKESNEAFAHVKATELEESIKADLQRSIGFLSTSIDVALRSIEDPREQAKVIKDILLDHRSGLSRTEVNSIFTHLMQHDTKFANHHVIPINTQSVQNLIDNATHENNAAITIDELERIIFMTRKVSIVRGFLQQFDQGAIKDQVISALKPFSRVSDDEEDIQEWVLCRDAYKALYGLTSLRLRRSQLLTLFAFAECYDENYEHVEILKFANFVSTIVSTMVSVQNLESRALAIRKGNLGEDTCLNNLTEVEIVQNLEKSLSLLPDGLVNEKKLIEILQQDLKNLSLSHKEAAAIVASMERTSDDDTMIPVADFLPSCYHTLLIVCRERYISRRQMLLDHRVSDGDVVAITSLVERMFEFMKLKHENDGLEISFYSDEDQPNNVLKMLSTGGASPKNNNGIANDEYSKTVSMTGEVDSLLLRFSSALRTEVYIARKQQTSEKSNKKGRLGKDGVMPGDLLKMVHNQIPIFDRGEDRQMYGIISIYENDVYTYPEKAPLEFHFTSADSTFSSSIGLPIRMPSIGIIDSEMAESFAKGIVKLIYLEYMAHTESYELKFNAENKKDDKENTDLMDFFQ